MEKRRDITDEDDDQVLRVGITSTNNNSLQLKRSGSHKIIQRENINPYPLEHNIESQEYIKKSRKSVTELTSKINKALTQLRGNSINEKLHQRINARLDKK